MIAAAELAGAWRDVVPEEEDLDQGPSVAMRAVALASVFAGMMLGAYLTKRRRLRRVTKERGEGT